MLILLPSFFIAGLKASPSAAASDEVGEMIPMGVDDDSL